MNNKIKYFSSSDNTLKLLIIGGILIYLGGYIIKSPSNSIINIIGSLNVILGLIVAIFGVVALLHLTPKLELNDKGIKDSRITKYFILWDEIENIDFIYEGSRNKLLLTLKKSLKLSKLTILYRQSKSKINNNELKIDLKQLDINFKQLISFLSNKNILIEN